MKSRKLFAFTSMVMTLFLTACQNPYLPNKPRKSSRENEVSIPEPVSEESTSKRSRSRNYSSEEHLEHSWSDWSIKKKATCLEDGYQERYCACGEVESEIIKAKGHDFENGIVLSDTSSCQTYGVKYVKCAHCSEILIFEGFGEHDYVNKKIVTAPLGEDVNQYSTYTREFCSIDDTMRLTFKATDSVISYDLSDYDTVKMANDSLYFNFNLNYDLDSRFDYSGTIYQKIYISDFSKYGSYNYYSSIGSSFVDSENGAFVLDVNGEIVDKSNMRYTSYEEMTNNGVVLDETKDISPYALCEIGKCTLKDGMNYIKYSINYINSPFKDFINIGELVFVGTPIVSQNPKVKYGSEHTGTLDDPFTPEDAIKVASSPNYDNEFYYVAGIIDIFITSPGNKNVSWYFKPAQEGGERFEAYGVYKQDGNLLTDDDVWIGGFAIVYGNFTFYRTVYETSKAIFISCVGDKPSARQYIDSNFDDVYQIGVNLPDNGETYDYYRFKAYVTVKNNYNYYLTKEKDEELRTAISDEQHGSQPFYENAIELYRVIDVDVTNKLTKGAYIEVTMNIKNYGGQPENGIALTANDVTVINGGSSWDGTQFNEPSIRTATVSEFLYASGNASLAYNVTGQIIAMNENVLTISDGNKTLDVLCSFKNDDLKWNQNEGHYDYCSDNSFNAIYNNGGLTVGKYASFKLIHTWYNDYICGIGVFLASYDHEPFIEPEGYKVNFITEHCEIKIYTKSGFDGSDIDYGYPYYGRDIDGNINMNSTIYIYFEVIPESGYEFYPGFEIGRSLQYGCSYITGTYSYLKRQDTNLYMIKGIQSDIDINIKATPIDDSSSTAGFVGLTNCQAYLTNESSDVFKQAYINEFFKCEQTIWFVIKPNEGYSLDNASFTIGGAYSSFERINDSNIFVIYGVGSVSISVSCPKIS